MTEMQWVLNRFEVNKTNRLDCFYLTKSLMRKYCIDKYEASGILTKLMFQDRLIGLFVDEKAQNQTITLGAMTDREIITQAKKIHGSVFDKYFSFEYGQRVKITDGNHSGKVGVIDDLDSEGVGTAIVVTDDDVVLVDQTDLTALPELA